ncbi:hypothetical protein [Varunaivibrio sulfuroxidans]|uniref:Uncharacterized protein n=1 Tax=Varunaivibrio sulfuroxidans TaxID=1773489 RepID=A0A4R3J7X6_9PROT|nr:hypothetical protein [Varunaivibrio sulfuroxidans]TCS60600.1 hypothetical protein EDD55_11075 [Varunaivibrio sulfuroxidans]WES30090.1 hypothetical protein P3M64_10640 [Varunaivibrio sulfuroxidans]
MSERNILVLARRDHAEAMRIAAGLTIFGHRVRLVFMSHVVEDTPVNTEMAELLELSEITPQTTVAEMEGELDLLSPTALAEAITHSDHVISA